MLLKQSYLRMRATPPLSVSLYLFLRVKEVKFRARPLDLRSALAARLQRCLDSRGADVTRAREKRVGIGLAVEVHVHAVAAVGDGKNRPYKLTLVAVRPFS